MPSPCKKKKKKILLAKGGGNLGPYCFLCTTNSFYGNHQCSNCHNAIVSLSDFLQFYFFVFMEFAADFPGFLSK